MGQGVFAHARAVNGQAFGHPHHIVLRLAERDHLYPVDDIDVALARVAVGVHPARWTRGAGVIRGRDHDHIPVKPARHLRQVFGPQQSIVFGVGGQPVGGVQRALEKRPVSADAIELAISTIKSQLRATGEREVPSEMIGNLVMGQLKELDKVAYIRFASVYRSFEDIREFGEEIAKLED